MKALVEARHIRAHLVREFGADLAGHCALASLLLADALGDISSLRLCSEVDLTWMGHSWNVIDGKIVDITATQFVEDGETFHDVLVTPIPYRFHQPYVDHRECEAPILKGYTALCTIFTHDWLVPSPSVDRLAAPLRAKYMSTLARTA